MQKIQAKKALDFIQPHFSKGAYRFMKTFSAPYLRLVEKVRKVKFDNVDSLVEEYKRFSEKKCRLILAFRHPTKHDPPVMVEFFTNHIKKLAKKKGIPIKGRTHVHFLYGRLMAQWAGGAAQWLFNNIGCIPVFHRKNDIEGMRTIREHLLNGQFPLALAPEGQCTYHNEQAGPMETGIFHMAQWTLDDLKKAGRDEEVVILPLSIKYDYHVSHIDTLFVHLVDLINKEMKWSFKLRENRVESCIALTEEILDFVEDHYIAYHKFEKSEVSDLSRTEALYARVQHLCDYVLTIPEAFFNIEKNGNFLDRILTIRERGASYMFRDDVEDFDALSDVVRESYDRKAREASMILVHNELADILEYVDPTYLDRYPGENSELEYMLNLYDILNRFAGGTIGSRYHLLKDAELISHEPIVFKDVEGRKEKRAQIEQLSIQLEEIFNCSDLNKHGI